jgi:hypothetical protein
MTHLAGVGTQVEKLGKATLVLMSLTLSPEKRMAGASWRRTPSRATCRGARSPGSR